MLFQNNDNEKPLLDKAGGLGIGYREDTLIFFYEMNNAHAAKINIADSKASNNNLLPYDWYKEFVVSGSSQKQSPAECISKLQAIAFISDPDKARRLQSYSMLSVES